MKQRQRTSGIRQEVDGTSSVTGRVEVSAA